MSSVLLNPETLNVHHDARSLILSAVRNGIDATFGLEDLPHRFYVGGVVRSWIVSAGASDATAASTVLGFLQSLEVRAALAEGNRAVGVWTDATDGRTYLDVVSSIDHRDFALEVAHLRGELAIWDSVRRAPIYVHQTADQF